MSASSATCATARSCVWATLSPNASSLSVTLSGTWSATILAEQSADGGTTWTTVAASLANGLTTYTVTSMTDFRVRVSAYTSGIASVTLSVGLLQVQSVVAGVSSSSSNSLGNLPSQLQDAYTYGVRSGQVRYTASMTSGGNVITCTNCFTLAQQGWLIQVTTGPSFAAGRAGSTLVLAQTTILTVTDASHVTVASGTANATVSNASVGFGPDSTTFMTNWWTAIAGSATTNCGSGIMPPGFIFVTTNFGSNTISCIPTGGEGTADAGIVIRGWGPKTSYIVPMSSFNFATNCTGGVSGVACFFDQKGMRLDSFGIYGLDYNNTNLASTVAILISDIDTEMSFVDASGWGAHDASNRLFGLTLNGGQTQIGINIDGAGSTGINGLSGCIMSQSFIGDQWNSVGIIGCGFSSTQDSWGPTNGGGTQFTVNGPGGIYIAFSDDWNPSSAATITIQLGGNARAVLYGVSVINNVNGGSAPISMNATSTLLSYGSFIFGPPASTAINIAAGGQYCGWGDTYSTSVVVGTPKCSITPAGFASYTHLNQPITASYAGSCSMAAGTTCTFTLTNAFTGTPLCFASIDPASTVPATANSAKCAISGTTVTVTAGISNSLTWDALLVGNPN